MSDMTLCPGDGCPNKNRCLRFRTRPLGREDFFAAPPYDRRTGECDAFHDIAELGPSDEQIRTRAHYLWISGGYREGRADHDWQEAKAELEASIAERLRPPAGD